MARTSDIGESTITVAIDKSTDDILVYANTAKDGSGTDLVPLVDADGHLQVDILSSGTLTVQATNLDIRDLANATDSVSIYGSDDGGTTKRIIKTGADGSVAVTGTFWQATQPVSLATVPSHAVTNAGTFVVQENGDALTALQLIDDAVYTDGAGTPSKGILIMGTDTTNPQAIAVDSSGNVQVDVLTMPTTTVEATNLDIRDLTNASDSVAVYGSDDAGTTKRILKTDAGGALQVDIESATLGTVTVTGDSSGSLTIDNASIDGPGKPTIDSYTHVAINLTTGADQVLVSSAANKQIWVYGYAFTCGDADGQTVSLQDEDNTAVTGIMEFSQYGGISVPVSGNFAMPVFKLATDKDLEVDITGGDVDGWLAYAIVSV